MLKGQAISPGYAIGRAYCLKPFDLDSVVSRSITVNEIDPEIARFQAALQTSRDEIGQLANLPQIKNSLEIANIFKAHQALVEDPDLKKEVIKRIRDQKVNVEAVVSKVILDYSEFFRSLPDAQFQEKAIDIMDIGRRILKNLQSNNPLSEMPNTQDGLIVVAEEISPSDIVGLEGIKILGIATSEGTATSHASILARSLGIPALIQVKNLMREVAHGSFVIIDGNTGTLVFDPAPSVIEEYNKFQADFEIRKMALAENIVQPAITLDQVSVRLCANIGQKQDVDSVLKYQANGIGLYRTEFTYLIRKRFPTEDELYNIYMAVVQQLENSEVVIRTIDLGGDKISHLIGNAHEKNPELGWRAVRMSFDRLDLFRTQLRAIIRTAGQNRAGQVKILFPMISNLSEVRRARGFIAEISADLRREGVTVPEVLPMGVMIEVPSAAILADKIARETDFMSIGSNDLVQYTLAVDRTNSKVAHLYQPTNPAVLKLFHEVVTAGERWQRPVSLCGELAGDWRYTLLLLGLGMRELSMNAIFIPKVKHVVRSVAIKDIRPKVLALLDLDTAEEIDVALEKLNAEYGIA